MRLTLSATAAIHHKSPSARDCDNTRKPLWKKRWPKIQPISIFRSKAAATTPTQHSKLSLVETINAHPHRRDNEALLGEYTELQLETIKLLWAAFRLVGWRGNTRTVHVCAGHHYDYCCRAPPNSSCTSSGERELMRRPPRYSRSASLYVGVMEQERLASVKMGAV